MLVKAPIYQQLYEQLRSMIRGNDFHAGEQFLTEREIGHRFGVSRATANKALASLVSEGVLEFRKGLGTFVKGKLLNFELGHLVSFTERARAAGKNPITKVIAFRKAGDGEGIGIVRESLAVDASDSLCYMERLRQVDCLPVIYERRYVVSSYCPRLTRRDVTGSLYSIWSGRYGLNIGGADETISAVSLTKDEAEILQVPRGAAALLVVATGFLEDETALWWERTLYRSDAYEFHNQVRGVATSPAVGRLSYKNDPPPRVGRADGSLSGGRRR